MFPALEALFYRIFPQKAVENKQVVQYTYTVNFEEDGSKTISDKWRPLRRQKGVEEEKRQRLSTLFTIEFEEDGETKIHHGWERFPLEERKAEAQRLRNSYVNLDSFMTQLARFDQLSPVINMLDAQSRARLSRTCKAMQSACERREVGRLELPITVVIYSERGEWLTRGEHRQGKRVLDVTPFRENLVKKCDTYVTRLEIEWFAETVVPFERVRDLLYKWNVISITELVVEMIGARDVHWRRQEFDLMARLAIEFKVKKLELPNAWVSIDMQRNNIADLFRNILQDNLNRRLVVLVAV